MRIVPPIKVLLVERRRLLAEVLGAILTAAPDCQLVGVHFDLESALDAVHMAQPEVFLLGAPSTLPAAFDYIAALRAARPTLKIMLLAWELDRDTLRACVEAGAVGHLTWDHSVAEVTQAIQQAAQGHVLFAPATLAHLLTQPAVEPARLRPRELEVLQALARGCNSVEAAAQMGITAATARTHLRNAMNTLGVHSTLAAVLRALQLGLITLPVPREPLAQPEDQE